MGRERRSGPGHSAPPTAVGNHAKERHRKTGRDLEWNPQIQSVLRARPEMPKSKHQTYLEFVENKDKKKKLEFKVGKRTHLSRAPRYGYHSFTSSLGLDHNRCQATAWFRIHSRWQPRFDQGLQRTLPRARLHDLHCLGMLCSPLPPLLPPAVD